MPVSPLEEKVQDLEISLATVGGKIDALVDKVGALDSAVRDHMRVHTGHDARLTVLETQAADRKASAEASNMKRLTWIGAIATLVAGLLGAVLERFLGGK
jgi:hypothetical protein